MNKEDKIITNSKILSISNLTRISIFISGIMYFSGLITTNIYLASYGFFLFHLLKIEYMIVGGLWFVLLALSFIIVGSIIEEYKKDEPRKWKRVLEISSSLTIIYLLIVLFLSVFSVNEVSGLSDIHLFYTCGVFLGQAISLHICTWAYHQWNIQVGDKKGHYILLSIGAFIFVFVFLSSYYRYALDIYPLYPRIIGGGRPTKAFILLKPEAKNNLKLLNILEDSDNLSKLVNIIYETSDAYFIIRDNCQSGKIASNNSILRKTKCKSGIKLMGNEVEAVIYINDK